MENKIRTYPHYNNKQLRLIYEKFQLHFKLCSKKQDNMTVSIVSSKPPCKEDNAGFTTVYPLNPGLFSALNSIKTATYIAV